MAFITPTRTAICMAVLLSIGACSRQADNDAQVPAAAADSAQEAGLAAEMSPSLKASTPPPPPPPATEAAAPAAAAPQANASGDATQGKLTSASPASQMSSGAASGSDGERKFIRTARASFEVKDVYAAALGIEDTVASHGGFVVTNAIANETMGSTTHPASPGKLMVLTEYAVKGNLVVRVPSAKTQEFLRAIVRHIAFLDERRFSAHDAQFDVLRQQLAMIRSQEQQGELGEAVREGGKLEQRTHAIEMRKQAREARDEATVARKIFEDQVAFSTIELQLHQPTRVLQAERIDLDGVAREHGPGFFTQAGEALRTGWEGLQAVALALLTAWPLTLAVLAGAGAVWRVRRRRLKPGAPAA